jgi:hypothetical protein
VRLGERIEKDDDEAPGDDDAPDDEDTPEPGEELFEALSEAIAGLPTSTQLEIAEALRDSEWPAVPEHVRRIFASVEDSFVEEEGA